MQDILQAGQDELGLGRGNQAAAGNGRPQARLVQCFGHYLAFCIGAAEDGHIARACRACLRLIFRHHQYALIQESLQAKGNAALHPWPARQAALALKLEMPVPQGGFHLGRVIAAPALGFQRHLLLGQVGESPHKQSIGSLDDIPARTPGKGLYVRWLDAASRRDDGLHQLWRGTAESVNGLLGVAHPDRVAGQAG